MDEEGILHTKYHSFPVYPVLMPSLIALPALQDNYIWSMTGDNGVCVLVDPGEAGPVHQAIRQGMNPCAILVTHHHGDHIGAIEELARTYSLTVYAPEDSRIPCATQRVQDGDGLTIKHANLHFSVLAVPGHTLSHVAYFGEGVVFTGDTLFSLGCGRLFEGTPEQMWASLQRLAALPAETRVCCAHEYTLSNAAFASVVDPDNSALQHRIQTMREHRQAGLPTLPVRLGDERATNPFLRCDAPAIVAAVASHTGRMPTSLTETFAALRRWKDGFVPA